MGRIAFKFFRYSVWLHRYLGISIGLLMVVWCLSGFVMMYMPYPGIDKNHEIQSLQTINLETCCDSAELESLKLVDINRFTIEMMSNDPVVRIYASGSQNPIVNLRSGEIIRNISQAQADKVAAAYAREMKIEGEISRRLSVEQDQWTVTRFYQRHSPFYFFAANDAKKTQWYISSKTGEVVQATTSKQRFWNYLGAVPHWLYPTVLRQHDKVWAQSVIYLSILGIFLTVLGIYLGIRQFRFRRQVSKTSQQQLSNSRSPYRGLIYWHHISGLTVGTLILTWVTSGLFSMNPWNMIDFSGGSFERNKLQGIPLGSHDLEKFLDTLAAVDFASDVVRIEGYALLGKLHLLITDEKGSSLRYDSRLSVSNKFSPAPIGKIELDNLTRVISAGRDISEAKKMAGEDNYYYSLHGERELPVYRILLNDTENTRLYLSLKTGELTSHLDKQKRIYRWIFSGIHQGDFSGFIRTRPIWDIMMWFALSLVSFATITGSYLGFKRLLRKNKK